MLDTIAAEAYMADTKPELAVVAKVQGQVTANILKGHLESEGIPVVLRYESAGQVFGIIVDGLGQVEVLVPQEFAEAAGRIIEPREIDGE